MKVHQRRDGAGIDAGQDERGTPSQGSVSAAHHLNNMAATGTPIRVPSPDTTSGKHSTKRRRLSPTRRSCSPAVLPESTTLLDLDWFPTNKRVDLSQLADLAYVSDQILRDDTTGSEVPAETTIPAGDRQYDSPFESDHTLAPSLSTSYDMRTTGMSLVMEPGTRQSMIWDTIGQPVFEHNSLAWGKSSSTDRPRRTYTSSISD